jgi:hypothetical protein
MTSSAAIVIGSSRRCSARCESPRRQVRRARGSSWLPPGGAPLSLFIGRTIRPSRPQLSGSDDRQPNAMREGGGASETASPDLPKAERFRVQGMARRGAEPQLRQGNTHLRPRLSRCRSPQGPSKERAWPSPVCAPASSAFAAPKNHRETPGPACAGVYAAVGIARALASAQDSLARMVGSDTARHRPVRQKSQRRI